MDEGNDETSTEQIQTQTYYSSTYKIQQATSTPY